MRELAFFYAIEMFDIYLCDQGAGFFVRQFVVKIFDPGFDVLIGNIFVDSAVVIVVVEMIAVRQQKRFICFVVDDFLRKQVEIVIIRVIPATRF